MSPELTVLYGSQFTPLRQDAFDRATSIADTHPESVLLIDENTNHHQELADEWATHYPPLSLKTTTFSGVIQDCYERLCGPADLFSLNNRRQLIAYALRDLDGELTLEEPHLHHDSFIELFNAFEADGLDSAAAIEDHFATHSISSQAAVSVREAYERYATLRDDLLHDGLYTLSEAYETVLTDDTPLEQLLPNVDVVVLSGTYQFTDLQQEFIRQLAESISVITILPLVDTQATLTDGANAAATEAIDYYNTLDATFEQVSADHPSPLGNAASAMYRPEADGTPIDLTGTAIDWQTAPTPDREIRQIASQIRHQLAKGVDPQEIIVAIPGLISYREHVQDYFDATDIPTAILINKLLYQTYVGRAVLDLLELCAGPQRADTVAHLAANPFVTIAEPLDESATSNIADLARRLPTTEATRLLEELEPELQAPLETLLDECQIAGEASGDASVDAIESLLETLTIKESLSELDSSDQAYDVQMEHRAFNQIQEVLDSVRYVCEVTDIEEALDLIDTELQTLRVSPPRQPSQGVVRIVGLEDAYLSSYTHLYLAGLTEADFPVRPERPHYFQTLFDQLDTLTLDNPRLEARYQFATLIASAESVYFTTPEATVTDEPLLESSILDELRRVSTLEPTTPELPIASREDLQRAINQINDSEAMQTAVTNATAGGDIAAAQADQFRAGIDCAAHRSAATLTPYDGTLAPETVDTLYPSDRREPYSPTRLKEYAQCGFKFYLNRVLGLDEPDEFTVEPDALDTGSLVHDTLERFFSGLQSEPRSPVDLREYKLTELEGKLLNAALVEIEAAEFPYDDQFYQHWLEQLLAGLGTPENNPYYGADRAHEGEDRGLFVRFVHEEYERSDTPLLFEAPLGAGTDGEELAIQTPSGNSVSVQGRIDRVGIRTDEETTEGIVYDYKTGNTSMTNTLEGIEFQLPLYATAAKNALNNESDQQITTVDSAFYQVKPPADISSTRSWTLKDYFDRKGGTDEDFEQFHTEVIPERLETIATAIERGAFHPAVVDEDTAGCEYCAYSDTCDVRPHNQRDTIEKIRSEGLTAYVPDKTREMDYRAQLGGDMNE